MKARKNTTILVMSMLVTLTACNDDNNDQKSASNNSSPITSNETFEFNTDATTIVLLENENRSIPLSQFGECTDSLETFVISGISIDDGTAVTVKEQLNNIVTYSADTFVITNSNDGSYVNVPEDSVDVLNGLNMIVSCGSEQRTLPITLQLQDDPEELPPNASLDDLKDDLIFVQDRVTPICTSSADDNVTWMLDGRAVELPITFDTAGTKQLECIASNPAGTTTVTESLEVLPRPEWSKVDDWSIGDKGGFDINILPYYKFLNNPVSGGIFKSVSCRVGPQSQLAYNAYDCSEDFTPQGLTMTPDGILRGVRDARSNEEYYLKITYSVNGRDFTSDEFMLFIENQG